MTVETEIELITDPEEAAAAAKLRYVSDDRPGFTRRRWGRGFSYFDSRGERISEPARRERLQALVIPPAWTDVWICPIKNGHIQATGRDEKGRKQYIYHPQWEVIRNETKFNRLLLFGEALPRIRAQVDQDLRRRSLSQERVLAAVVRLLEKSLIRVGNAEYARKNQSYGLTTMTTDHVDVTNTTLYFDFRGKSGKEHHVEIRDRRIARVIKQCQELPGHELFQYWDEAGEVQCVDSADVNAYLQAITGEAFSAKDFRTWGGTVAAVQAFIAMGPAETEKQAEKNIAQAVKEVATRLGNTTAVCRQYYIHPAVLDAYIDGSLFDEVAAETTIPDAPGTALDLEERILLNLLRRRLTEKG